MIAKDIVHGIPFAASPFLVFAIGFPVKAAGLPGLPLKYLVDN